MRIDQRLWALAMLMAHQSVRIAPPLEVAGEQPVAAGGGTDEEEVRVVSISDWAAQQERRGK